MLFGDLNFMMLIFFLMFTSIGLNVNTALHLLLTAEFLWITLYILALLMGLLYDNLNMLSMTFFFLMLSAVEFGLGLVMMLVQNMFLRSINLNDNATNYVKLSTRIKSKLNTHSTQLYA